MLLRTALISLLATACCQIGYGQYPPRGVASGAEHAGPCRRISQEAAEPATAPARVAAPIPANGTQPQANHGLPAASSSTPPASNVAPEMDYGMQTMPSDSVPADAACGEGECSSGPTHYVPWWHRAFVWSYWKCKGLPSPWCSPGNMSLHLPCNPCTGTYYYFRPYNWFHISEQQQEAANYEGDPRNPYDNRVVFDGLYDGL